MSINTNLIVVDGLIFSVLLLEIADPKSPRLDNGLSFIFNISDFVQRVRNLLVVLSIVSMETKKKLIFRITFYLLEQKKP